MPQKRKPAPGRHLDHQTYVPGLVTWLANKLSAGASKLYRAKHDLGVIEWRVLATVAAEDGCTAARICQIVGLDKAAVSRSFVILTERGLLELEAIANRAKPAHLTAAGRLVHDAVLDLALARQARLLAALTPAEIAELIRLLHLLLGQVPDVNRDVDLST